MRCPTCGQEPLTVTPCVPSNTAYVPPIVYSPEVTAAATPTVVIAPCLPTAGAAPAGTWIPWPEAIEGGRR